MHFGCWKATVLNNFLRASLTDHMLEENIQKQ